ncbi:MAG: CRISPR-associated endonuclease Cas3'', partial [Thermotogae bacterium]|nr:CRISPR-associated endonuclease Cas3'' [Thermotogota bacterium]
MDISIFEVLRAKSADEDGHPESLKEHIKNALDRVIELYNFITSMTVDWRTFKEKEEQEIFFKNLAKAIILHDFGKIDYKFQRQLFKEEEKKNNSEWLKIERFFSNDIKKVHFPRHEILSSIFASFLLDNSNEWSKKIMTVVLLHHYNNYFTDIPLLPMIIRDFEEDIEGYMKFVSERKEIFKESYDEFLDNFLSKFPDITFIQEAIEELKGTANWDNAEKLLNSYLDDDLSEFVDFYEPKNNLSDETGELSEDAYKFLVFLGTLRRA